MVVVRGEECGAAFRNGKVEIIFSEVVLKDSKVCVCVGFRGGDVCNVPLDMMLMSSAYWERAVLGSVGRGMSCMSKLNRMGEITEP